MTRQSLGSSRLWRFDLQKKVDEAKKVVDACRTSEGFHASAEYYPDLWLRDLVFSEGPLLKLGYADSVRTHLESFVRLQRPNGQLPTVISSSLRGALNQRFQRWTADTEILFLIGSREYAQYTGDGDFLQLHAGELDRTRSFVESRMKARGLIPGMDWRDALPISMDKHLLVNQLLLVDMYDLEGKRDRSLSLRGAIRENFYSKDRGYFADSVWWDGNALRKELRFDSLGNALAILNDTAAGDLAESVVQGFRRVKTKSGYRNLFPPYKIDRVDSLTHLTFLRNGAIFRNRRNHNQNSGIWPFIEARIIRALLKLGRNSEADRASRMVLSRSGCNEWYSPTTGAPKGSGRQLWTAAAILEVASLLE